LSYMHTLAPDLHVHVWFVYTFLTCIYLFNQHILVWLSKNLSDLLTLVLHSNTCLNYTNFSDLYIFAWLAYICLTCTHICLTWMYLPDLHILVWLAQSCLTCTYLSDLLKLAWLALTCLTCTYLPDLYIPVFLNTLSWLEYTCLTCIYLPDLHMARGHGFLKILLLYVINQIWCHNRVSQSLVAIGHLL